MSEVQSISFTDKPDPKLEVGVWVYHEENEMRRRVVIAKNDQNYAKRYNELIADKTMEAIQEDSANVIFLEKTRKPKAFLCRYEGLYTPLHNYIYGEYVDDGQVIRQVNPPHPRTYSVGMQGQQGGKAYYEQDKQRVIDAIKARNDFSEIVETTWDKMRVMR